MMPLTGHGVLRASLVAVVIVLAMRAFYRRWLGGITGDLIGAAGEIVETAVLIVLTR
jgi:cobalamin synthase